MKITNGDKSIKISIWEITAIIGGISGAICSIFNVINKYKSLETEEE